MSSIVTHDTADDASIAAVSAAANDGTRDAPAFGALSSTMKDYLYLIEVGFIFTSPWVRTQATVRRSATILLTAGRAPFEVKIGDSATQYQAVGIKPLVVRGVRAENVKLVSVQFGPVHPQFRAFRGIPAPGALPLDRDAFAQFDETLEAAYQGKLPIEEAPQLFEGIVAATARHLPKVKPADPRVERAMELLSDNANRPLDELASAVGLSYGRMSQLFAETVGISLRSYQLWLKVRNAIMLIPSGRKLTEIAHLAGFTDLAHLSRIYKQAYGAPLSYFLNANYVQRSRTNGVLLATTSFANKRT
jgi:AraC-like DNA-binding protein